MYVGLTSKHKNVQGEYCTVLNNYSMYTFIQYLNSGVISSVGFTLRFKFRKTKNI